MIFSENLFGCSVSNGALQPSRPVRRKEEQTHYRARIASISFPEITKGLAKVSPYNMPVIRANNNIPVIGHTTPFDRMRSKKSQRESLIIFYLNDDRFAGRLTHPWDYTEQMREYFGVIGPDLSQYIEMDYAMRLTNNYWNKALTAYWQNQGLNIYPNVTWSLPDSYEYSVAGLPKHSVIAINSMGVPKCEFSVCLWLQGYHYMVEALKPTLVLRYGPKIKGEDESISFYLENKQLNILRNGSKRK